MSPLNFIPSSFFNKPWHRFKNGAGEEIPAYACMRITSATEIDNDIVFVVAKPNADDGQYYLVNGPVAVANDEDAEGRGTPLKQAGYILVSGGPVFGNHWGPTDGAWEVSEGGKGFFMLGPAQSNPTRAPALQKSGSGMHLAKVPATGIPARSGLNPGTFTADIWKLDSSGNLEDALFDQTIHNIYPVSVAFSSATPYFQVHQDNYGNWFNEAPQQTQVIGVPFYNNSGEVMPPGALIRVGDGSVDIDDITYIEGLKPNADFYNFYLVNGPTAVNALGTSYGSFLKDIVGGVLLGDSYTPTVNDSWGPRKNQWGVYRDRPGFAPLSNAVKTISGYRQGYFKQREINDVYGRYYDTLSPGGSALFEIWIRVNNVLVSSGWNKIQVFDHDWLEDDEEVEPNTIGMAHFYSQVWESGLTKCRSQNVSGSEGFVPLLNSLQEQNNALALTLIEPASADVDPNGLNTALGLPI